MENSIKEKILEYLGNSINCINSLKDQTQTIENIFKLIKENREKKRRIFLIGNGGSASTASHFVCDLNKTAINQNYNRSQAFALNDNSPHVLAIANDIDFNSIFEEQLKNFLEKEDVVIAISGSGNSQNIIKAVNYANTIGAVTIGLTGFDGGKLKDLCHECLVVSSDKMYHTEDVHLMINHIITFLFTGYSYR